MASRDIGQHQYHFLAVLSILLLAAWLGSQLQANAQQEYENTNEGYSCSDSGTKSCNTFVLYRAQEKYSTVPQIAELFNVKATVVANLNKLSTKQTLDKGKAVIIPVTCRCWANSISFANISYTIVEGDYYWLINVNKFESLSTVTAIEAANPKQKPKGLRPDQKIVFPLRCACPSKAQTSKGVKSLVTYPVLQDDNIGEISSHFGVSSADVINANTLMASNSRIIAETTLVIPIYASQPSYRNPYEGPPPDDDLEAPPTSTSGGSNNMHIHKYIIPVGVSLLILVAIVVCFATLIARYRKRNGGTEDVEQRRRLVGPPRPPTLDNGDQVR